MALEFLLAALLGGIGGLTRGGVGLLKALSLRRRILWSYWVITVVIAVIIGCSQASSLTLILVSLCWQAMPALTF